MTERNPIQIEIAKALQQGGMGDAADFVLGAYVTEVVGKATPDELPDVIQLGEDCRKLTNPEKQRVVCAANRCADGYLLLGARHGDALMHEQAVRSGRRVIGTEEGFVDQWGNFLTREEAYVIAERQGQYRPWGTHIPGVLFSEDLY